MHGSPIEIRYGSGGPLNGAGLVPAPEPGKLPGLASVGRQRLHAPSTLHQLAPYIGKMPPEMTERLVKKYSSPGDTVLDPFSGSGTVPLEALSAGRHALALDTSAYAVAVTRAKIHAPTSAEAAIRRARKRMREASERANDVDLRLVPTWVRAFFHPETLRNTIALTEILQKEQEHFLLGCLLGILHHQRAGFLSYPASHFSPYLRTNLFPRSTYPQLYEERAILPRLEKKIIRAYSAAPPLSRTLRRECWKADAARMDLAEDTVQAVITSPPYMNELDYGRDNRLRLWFLGEQDYRRLDTRVSTRDRFIRLMRATFRRLKVALVSGGYCVMVVGESRRSHDAIDVARLLMEMAVQDVGGFERVSIRRDAVPRIKRTIVPHDPRDEWIVVLRRT